MTVYKLDNNALKLLFVIYIITLIVINMVLNYYLYSLLDKNSIEEGLLEIVKISQLVGNLLLLAFSVFYFWNFKNTARIFVTEDALIFQKGVFLLTENALKIDSILYFREVKVALISRVGFNFLVVFSLGGKMILPFLSSETLSLLKAKLCL